jgi:hypothetical protein
MVAITELNLTPVISRASECFTGGSLKVSCIVNQYCPQVSGYIGTTALILLIAYVVVDLLIPLFFARILPKLDLEPFYRRFPNVPFIRTYENQARLLAWLKDKLLWAFAVFCLYSVMILK